MRKQTRRVLGIAYTVAALGGLAWLAVTRRAEVTELFAGTNPLALVGVAVVAVVSPLIAAAFHATALGALGQQVGAREVAVASLRALPARYLPGSVWYIGGRAALLRARGVTTRALGATAVLEQVLSLATALAVGVALLGGGNALFGVGGWVGATLALVVIVVSLPLANRVLAFRTEAPHLRVSGVAWLRMESIMVSYWVWTGTVFTAYLWAIGLDAAWLATAGAYMVSWSVGWLVPVAPQGLGVFETVAASLLPGLDVATGIVGVAGFRLVILLRDLLGTLLGTLLARNQTVDDHS